MSSDNNSTNNNNNNNSNSGSGIGGSGTTARYTTFNFFKNVAEYFVPVLKTSHFTEKGVLTPEEFVLAGDLIVSRCPTWSWSAGDPSKAKSYLPADKQFLVTRNVPCLKRAKALEQEAESGIEDEIEGEDGWVATHVGHAGLKEGGDGDGGDDDDDGIIDLDKDDGDDDSGEAAVEDVQDKMAHLTHQDNQDDADADDDDDDVIDIDDFDLDDVEDEDFASLLVTDEKPSENDDDSGDHGSGGGGGGDDDENDNVMKTRTYDLSITYDKFYQTPRVWLFGYDENGKPLDPKRVLEDVHSDYSLKTVTIEQHPHLNGAWASIHPCKHADVMKKMIDRLYEDGKYPRVDLYLYLFLKFISSAIPTIEYDYSISM